VVAPLPSPARRSRVEWRSALDDLLKETSDLRALPSTLGQGADWGAWRPPQNSAATRARAAELVAGEGRQRAEVAGSPSVDAALSNAVRAAADAVAESVAHAAVSSVRMCSNTSAPAVGRVVAVAMNGGGGEGEECD
jgi:hypothetical protein